MRRVVYYRTPAPTLSGGALSSLVRGAFAAAVLPTAFRCSRRVLPVVLLSLGALPAAPQLARAICSDGPDRSTLLALVTRADGPGRSSSLSLALATDGPGLSSPSLALATRADGPDRSTLLSLALVTRADGPGRSSLLSLALATDGPGLSSSSLALATRADGPGRPSLLALVLHAGGAGFVAVRCAVRSTPSAGGAPAP